MIQDIQFSGLIFSPPVAWGWFIGLVVVSLLVSGLVILQGGRGRLTRLALVAGLLLLIANPSLVSEQRNYLKDVVLLVLDDSDSQSIGERRKRLTETQQALQQKLAAFPDIEVQTVSVKQGDTVAPDGEEGTRLFRAREEFLRSTPSNHLAATLLITDGQVHDVPDSASLPASSEPIHAFLTGEREEKDRILTVQQYPAYGIVNKPVSLRILVEDHPRPDGPARLDNALITVRLDGNVINRTAVIPGKPADLELTLPHGGENFVEISTSSLPGELSLRNNSHFLSINGIRDRLKVLLVSGEPHMGERGWRNILKADPSVDLVHFTILRPPEKQDGTPINELSLIPFPIKELFEDKLEEFDLIIFDRYRRRGVLAPHYLQNIVEYVEKGGALLEAAGPSFATPLSLYRTPLATVLPGQPTGTVYRQGFIPTISKDGKRHPVTARLAPTATDTDWGRWFRMIDADNQNGTVLMTGPEERPLLMLARQDKGRVAQLMSDHAWLWGRGFEGGGPQSELLRRVSHWLMKEPELEEEKLTATLSEGQLQIRRHTLGNDPAPVTVTRPGGEKTTVPLEKGAATEPFQAAVPVAEDGLYRLSSDGLSALVAVGAMDPLESRDVRTTDEKLLPVTQATDGKIHWSADPALPDFRRTDSGASQSSQYWMGLRKNRNFEVTGYSKTALFPPLVAALLLIGLLGFSWWRESR